MKQREFPNGSIDADGVAMCSFFSGIQTHTHTHTRIHKSETIIEAVEASRDGSLCLIFMPWVSSVSETGSLHHGRTTRAPGCTEVLEIS